MGEDFFYNCVAVEITQEEYEAAIKKFIDLDLPEDAKLTKSFVNMGTGNLTLH